MDYKDILYTKEHGIATITMNRPDRMNAFGPDMIDSIRKAVKDAATDDEVRVLILTGTGRAFSTGADVKAMSEAPSPPSRKDRRWEDLPLYPLLHSFEKPIIAVINGVAAGGGFDLALASDIRIASDKARFAELFIRRGLIPVGGGTYFLPRLIGIDKACQLIWTGDMIDASEAERIGLVTMVVPHEELESAAMDMAEKLAKGPPIAIKMAKRAIYYGLTTNLKSAMDYVISLDQELYETEDHKEGARAFVEKREPIFRGK